MVVISFILFIVIFDKLHVGFAKVIYLLNITNNGMERLAFNDELKAHCSTCPMRVRRCCTGVDCVQPFNTTLY